MPRPAKRDIPHLVERILPRYGVHLLGGPSGAGKTTWLFQFLKSWTAGEPVLGLGDFKSIPAPWAYVSCDRPAEDTWRTIDQIGFKPDEKLVMAWDEDLKTIPKSISGLQTLMQKLPIKDGLLCIDDLAALMSDGDSNSGRDVRNFMRACRLIAAQHNAAIIGCVHNAKAKPGDEYKAPRQRIAGSAEWGHYAGTVLLIEQNDDVGADRTFWYQPRHYRDGKMPLLMNNDGCLQEAQDDITSMAFDNKLAKMQPGEQLTTQLVMQWVDELKMTTRTGERWIKRCLDEGKIERVSRGIFRKTVAQ